MYTMMYTKSGLIFKMIEFIGILKDKLVRRGGLGPPRALRPQDPQSCASTNSATAAWKRIISKKDLKTKIF